jgi:peptidoglycan hydrolase CwlO-like protein
MLKRVFIIGGGALFVLVLLFGKSTVSYLRTSAGYVSDAAQESVPIEFQIDRARGMIKDLVPEVRKNMQVIAKEEVEVKKLEEQIAQTQTRLAKEKEQLLRLKTDLASGKSNFTYASRSYSVEQVKTDMANRFERYKTGEATLASLEQMLTARQRSLEAARQKLEGMLAAKRQLAVEVENLEARLQMVAAAQSTSAYQFDDSRLGQAKELIAKLRTRLDVAEKLANAETKYQGEIQLEGTSPANIVEEVTEHFAGDSPTKLAAATQK